MKKTIRDIDNKRLVNTFRNACHIRGAKQALYEKIPYDLDRDISIFEKELERRLNEK